jgi:hypothetical protein
MCMNRLSHLCGLDAASRALDTDGMSFDCQVFVEVCSRAAVIQLRCWTGEHLLHCSVVEQWRRVLWQPGLSRSTCVDWTIVRWEAGDPCRYETGANFERQATRGLLLNFENNCQTRHLAGTMA